MEEMTETKALEKAREIVKQLDGLRISEAQWVLTEARGLLVYTHRVDVNNPDFTGEVEGAMIVSDE